MCDMQKCRFLKFYASRPAPTAVFDFGEQEPLSAWECDRFTTLSVLTRWFGFSFSQTLWERLINAKAGASFPKGSKELYRGESYNAFISYRGNQSFIPFAIHSILIH